jgi:hypothetical protein
MRRGNKAASSSGGNAVTTAVIGLGAAYVVLAVLLLSLNLTSLWRWWIKAAAIIVTTAFFGVTFQAVNGLMGWPTTQKLPARFNLVWSLVVEPDKKYNDPGCIYLWAEELDANNIPSSRPRSYQLPYSDALARNIARAQEKRDRGVEVMGRVEDGRPPHPEELKSDIKMGRITNNGEEIAAVDSVPFMDNDARLSFEELPPVILPDKGPL